MSPKPKAWTRGWSNCLDNTPADASTARLKETCRSLHRNLKMTSGTGDRISGGASRPAWDSVGMRGQAVMGMRSLAVIRLARLGHRIEVDDRAGQERQVVLE